MAQIVLGMGTSHSPMLSTPPEEWGQRAEFDKIAAAHPYRGENYTFDELLEKRKDGNFGDQVSVEIWREKYAACMERLDNMAQAYEAAAPDVAVIFGNDQNEVIIDTNMPAFSVFWGEKLENIPYSEAQKEKLNPGIGIAEPGHTRDQKDVYDGCPELGKHIIEHLIQNEFDVGQSTRLPEINNHWWSGVPHAFGFIYRQIMRDAVIPNVPVFTNTFFPPNQPTVTRCYKFGKEVRKAVESWDKDLKVAGFCSGGLSHFTIDEELDRDFLDAIESGDEAKILAIPNELLVSGTSELKNWIALAGFIADTDLKSTAVDYIPCYRSAAGTGNAMAFAIWN